MKQPLSGLQYLLAGFRLIAQPGLRLFVIAPLAINILLFIGLFAVAKHFMVEFNAWFAHYLPHWLHWLSTVLWLLFFASFFLLLIYTFVTVANLVSAPFNSFLAEKVELHLTGKMLEPRSLLDNIKDIPRILGRQLSILGYYLPRALLLFILFFVPGVQAIAPLVWFAFHAWLMALTYIDYPTDNHRVSMPDTRAWLQQRRGHALGFGASVMVVTMIPIMNLLIIPAATAGATKFWLEEQA
jgi:CysZ protein